ncbi:hypothetical protein THIOKS1860019 [Thiocapsa sp. KS1]|nr:hypothetical protein [Thiocapsa sp. KS1]CRI67850.1 hypothetical protein THIOKS1860019 [Thiocapsa sp. KS1]
MSAPDLTDGSADAWIWPEDQGLRWWTPFGTKLLDQSTPGPWGSLTALRELRDCREFCTRGAGLVGHPGGLLVDGDPQARDAVLHRQMEDCLAYQSDEKSDWECHKLKNRAARSALQMG